MIQSTVESAVMSARNDFQSCWETAFWERVERRGSDDCWEWTGNRSTAHRGILNPTPTRKVLAHRYSYWLHNGGIPDGAVVCHRCDNPPCVNPNHLFAGTQRDNLADMTAKGRRFYPPSQGEKNGKSKISDAECARIAAALAAGTSPTALARSMGVARTTVYRAAARAKQ